MSEELVPIETRMKAASSRLPWAVFALVSLLLVAAAFTVADYLGRKQALAEIEAQGLTDANLKVSLLRAVLERPRALPMVLSLDREVQDALSRPTEDNRTALDRKLEQLINGTSASVLYVMDASGLTIASSNWREPTSFVGENYAFRPYFAGAIATGSAEHFALGSVSKRPGLYISSRIGPADAPLGVIVVKMEFSQLEADWSDAQRPVYVVDERGVVLISSIPSWRFMTTIPLPEPRRSAIRESLQFGEAPLVMLPYSGERRVSDAATMVGAVLPGSGSQRYMRISVPALSTPWTLDYLVPTEPAIADALWRTRMTALLALAPLLALAGFWLRRRQRALAAIQQAEAARLALELRVAERTADLSLARDRLQTEAIERRQAEARLQSVQQELVQANRLAILGQVAAGVAHEINQPIATIRAYADNAKVFIARANTETALDNLDQIASLTERVGAITDDLKALARRGRTPAEPVQLSDVIDGAVELLQSRFAGSLDALAIDRASLDRTVLGNSLRLEQVFINLFQNALEAIEGRPGGGVTVSAESLSETVVVRIADNGPGIPEPVLAELFSPFNSSKDKGLGLGLVICKDIVADYDGRIEVESSTEGACFRVHLKMPPAGPDGEGS